MGKNANFTGQPIFSQVLKFVDRSLVARETRRYGTDRYYKRFFTYDHLVTMLYSMFHKCTSLREVITGMQVCSSKLKHLGLIHSPRRSTISDANANRSSEVFEKIYYELYKQLRLILPDSRSGKTLDSRLYIIDSTTISLFKEILKNAGRTGANGKRKGGIKAHTMIRADEDVPCLVTMTAAAKHDAPFIKGLKLPKGSIVVFDKAYLNHKQYALWSTEGVFWVTRMKNNAHVEVLEDLEVSPVQKKKGVVSDQKVVLGHTSHKNSTRIEARLITYYGEEKKKTFSFITNCVKLAAFTIAGIYKRRWRIEVLFKRIKQNFPLQYFLGDSENAVRIQIWCALIADLIIKVIQKSVKRKWSFANLSSMLRIHLMTYVSLIDFLNNPEKSLLNYANVQNKGPTLF